MPKKSKQGAYQHTKANAWNRYKVYLTPNDQDSLVIHQIQNPHYNTYPHSLTNSRTLHLVDFGNMRLPVVYDKKHKVILTVLPIDNDHVLKHYSNVLALQ